MTKLKIIGTILLSSLLTYGNCAKVVFQGTEVPYDGILFTMQEEEKLRTNNEKLIKLEQLSILYEKKSEIDEQRITSYKEYVKDTKAVSGYSAGMYFFFGLVTSGLMFYTTSKVIENSK